MDAKPTEQRRRGSFEVTRFNETIDQAIAEIIRRYADRSERYSDVFLSILSHEVRNFLNIIRLSGESLAVNGPSQEAQSASAARILRVSEALID